MSEAVAYAEGVRALAALEEKPAQSPRRRTGSRPRAHRTTRRAHPVSDFPLIGSKWRAREPDGSALDEAAILPGHRSQPGSRRRTRDRSAVGIPVGETISATVESFTDHYARVTEDDLQVADLRDRLARAGLA